VWVRQAAKRAKKCAKIDFRLKEGIPSIPKLWFEFLTPYCDPKPTKSPAIINLRDEVSLVNSGGSKGLKLV